MKIRGWSLEFLITHLDHLIQRESSSVLSVQEGPGAPGADQCKAKRKYRWDLHL